MSTGAFDILSNRLGTKSIGVDNVIDGTAKVWASLNGTGTIALRGSLNVASVVDDGTGRYTFNYTNAMADTDYTLGASAAAITGGNPHMVGPVNGFAALAVGSVAMGNNQTTSATDRDFIPVEVFGDLA